MHTAPIHDNWQLLGLELGRLYRLQTTCLMKLIHLFYEGIRSFRERISEEGRLSMWIWNKWQDCDRWANQPAPPAFDRFYLMLDELATNPNLVPFHARLNALRFDCIICDDPTPDQVRELVLRARDLIRTIHERLGQRPVRRVINFADWLCGTSRPIHLSELLTRASALDDMGKNTTNPDLIVLVFQIEKAIVRCAIIQSRIDYLHEMRNHAWRNHLTVERRR